MLAEGIVCKSFQGWKERREEEKAGCPLLSPAPPLSCLKSASVGPRGGERASEKQRDMGEHSLAPSGLDVRI